MVGGRGRGERHVMRNSRDLHSDHPRCHRQKKNSLKFPLEGAFFTKPFFPVILDIVWSLVYGHPVLNTNWMFGQTA